MSDGEPIPTLDKKLKTSDFVRGFWESVNLYKDNPEARVGMGIALITGLISTFPEYLNYKNLNQTEEYKQLVAVTYLATQVNDYIDMHTVLNTTENKEKLKKKEETWRMTLEAIGFDKILSLEKTDLIRSYISGVALINEEAKHDQDKSFKATRRYKELENAISLVHIAAIALGKDKIGINGLELDKELNIAEIESQYDWLLAGNPKNEVQRRLCGLFNIVMMTQIVDDTKDCKVDQKLGIRNLFVDADQNSKITEMWISKYLTQAKKFGVTRLAFEGNKLFMNIYKDFQYQFPAIFGGSRERQLG
jgi:hypothetical protein